MNAGKDKHLLNVPQVANYLGFSIAAIRKWVRRGVIPFDKVNGTIRFDMERINQWLEDETQKHPRR
jgi:excisionase family DNA binding protein